MLSKKMAVSLTSLITILAFAFITVPVMAADDFDATFTWDSNVREKDIMVTLTFGDNVGLTNAQAAEVMVRIVAADGTEVTKKIMGSDANAADPIIGILSAKDTNMVLVGTQADGKTFMFTIPAAQTSDGDSTTTDNSATVKTSSIQLFIAKGVMTADLSDEKSSKQGSATISLTDDPGDISALPKVVSIQRLRPGSQTVVAAFQEDRILPEPFTVRVVLTEAPNGIGIDTSTQAKRDESAKNLLEVENGVPSNLFVGTTFTRLGPDADPPGGITDAERAQTIRPHPVEGMYWHDNTAPSGLAGVARPDHADLAAATAAGDLIPLPTSDDNLYRQYRVTITPHQKSANFDIKIKVKNFHDNGSTVRNTYVSPGFGESVRIPNGRDILTIPVLGAERDLTAGYKVTIPKEIRIPGGGYLVIAQNEGGSEVVVPPGSKKDAPKATERTPAQMIYNVIEYEKLPNLAEQFRNGVVLDIVSQHAGLVVSEVMWGEDVSLATSSNSQYIELYNPGGDYVTIDDKDETPDVNEALTLIFYGSNEFDDIPERGDDDSLPDGVTDRVGTLDIKGAYWSPESKGSSGRSGSTPGELREGRGEFVDAVPIVSMYRVMEDDDTIDATMGQMAASWMSSMGPKTANFDPLAIGVRHGTPGAATDATVTPADTEAEAKEKADKEKADADKIASTGTIPTAGKIYISEIMFAGGGSLPQWIEISNGSATEDVNLSGWTLKIDNAAGAADAGLEMVTSAKFTIPDGTMIDRSRQTDSPSTVLVVAYPGRYDLGKGEGQIIDLKTDNEVELITAGVLDRRYILLSDEAFLITLAPPEPEKSDPPKDETKDAKAKRQAAETEDADMRKKATDMAGNLSADNTAAWALPMDEEGRSSIIRKHINVSIGPSEPEDGMMMDNWTLASATAMQKPQHLLGTQSYYGAPSDKGTPGYRAGGALPVELSHFRPVRDKATGQVVITWSTQSELNNAGFFVKRSQQRNGEFKIINAAMVQGAGTTSEKQFYTYTDTTAQPNVVYYYQIEDVSFDGNRQTLTRGIRLKGHVGAAGKATTLWGELKTSHE